MKFSFYPIEKVEYGSHRGGAHDDDFDASILPLQLMDRLTIEDISGLIPPEEFETYKASIGSWAYDKLDYFKYAIVHRYPEYETDSVTGKYIVGPHATHASWQIVRSASAVLRLLRPTTQYLGLFHGEVREDGMFTRIGFDSPMDFVNNPVNQRNFGFRTRDAQDLKTYLPLFLSAMEGPFWKFRMAVQMHESAFFQNDEWRAKFFLYTTAVESLFTTQSKRAQHSGSLVATERIKFFLGANTTIYPPGELTSAYPPSCLTVADVVNEIYCLRNHIAHGDRTPTYYSEATGRPEIFGGNLTKYDTLLEAISFIIRHSLLKILRDNLLDRFGDASSSETYFDSYGLTKDALKKAGVPHFPCPA
jgi:hypothetical protein